MDVVYRCPQFRAEIAGLTTRCAACGADHPAVQVGSVRVVDFLAAAAADGRAGPEYHGDAYRRADLNALSSPATPAPGARHGKAKVLRCLGRPRGKVIVDVGCREGPIGRLLADENDLIGVDVSPGNMLTGQPNALDAGYRQLLLADAHNLPLADGQADIILATDILEHVTAPEALMAEFARVLKDGGQLLITVPNLVSCNNRLSILFGSGVGIELHQLLKGRSIVNPITGPRYPDQKQHVRWFTLRSLRRMAAACGFVVRRRFGYDPVFSRLPLCDRLLRNACQVVGILCAKG
jgi:ubiquinone/menaquinone biosynthesis C-methylase UbiE